MTISVEVLTTLLAAVRTAGVGLSLGRSEADEILSLAIVGAEVVEACLEHFDDLDEIDLVDVVPCADTPEDSVTAINDQQLALLEAVAGSVTTLLSRRREQ